MGNGSGLAGTTTGTVAGGSTTTGTVETGTGAGGGVESSARLTDSELSDSTLTNARTRRSRITFPPKASYKEQYTSVSVWYCGPIVSEEHEMMRVHTVFDCKHEQDLEVQIEDDVIIPASVRGLGKCPTCKGEVNSVPIAGVAPGADGRELVLDSILMMPVDG